MDDSTEHDDGGVVWQFDDQVPDEADRDVDYQRERFVGTRRRILEAAARVLRDKGYAGARLSDIAALVRMRTASLYYYFESKETLAKEVFRVGTRTAIVHVGHELDRLGDDADAEARLAAAIRAHLHVHLGRSGVFGGAMIRVLGQAPADVRERHLVLERDYADLWRRLLEDAVKAEIVRDDVDLSALRMLLMGSLNWTSEWFAPGRLTVDQLADTAVDLVFGGIRALPRS